MVSFDSDIVTHLIVRRGTLVPREIAVPAEYIATTDEQTRHVRRLLARVAAGEPPYPEPRSKEPSTGED